MLATIVVLAFLLERALAPLFEHRAFLKRFASKGIKELIALGVCVAVCVSWQFDAFSMIVLTEQTTRIGAELTGPSWLAAARRRSDALTRPIGLLLRITTPRNAGVDYL